MRLKGFTLIEMLIVIAIIALLAGMLLPVYSAARNRAHQTVCLANLKQIGMAIEMYCSDNDGRMPMQSYLTRFHQWWSEDTGHIQDECLGDPEHPVYWYEALESYVGNEQIWYCPSVGLDDKVVNPENPSYRIPTFREMGTSYAFNYRTPPRDTPYRGPTFIFSGAQLDRIPSTVSLAWDMPHWRYPNNHNVRSPHHNGVNALHADGAVRWEPFTTEGQAVVGNYYIDQSWKGIETYP